MFKFINKIIYGRLEYSPKMTYLLKFYGNNQILRMKCCRHPIPDILPLLGNIISMNKLKQNNPYDKLFHLYLEIHLQGGPVFILEKNEVINLEILKTINNKREVIDINLNNNYNLTLDILLDNTLKLMGKENFYRYSAYNNNCQTFISNILKANNLLTYDLNNFIIQDTQQLFNNLTNLRKFTNTLTDIGGRFDVIKQGGNKDNGLSNINITEILKIHNIPHNGVYSKDKLPNKIKSGWYIVNMQNYNDGNGTHWVAFQNNEKECFYYDSFGVYPPLEILEKVKNNLLYSTKEIQNEYSTCCGWFCICCIVYNHYNKNNYEDFLKLFSKNTALNDSILFKILKKYNII